MCCLPSRSAHVGLVAFSLVLFILVLTHYQDLFDTIVDASTTVSAGEAEHDVSALRPQFSVRRNYTVTWTLIFPRRHIASVDQTAASSILMTAARFVGSLVLMSDADIRIDGGSVEHYVTISNQSSYDLTIDSLTRGDVEGYSFTLSGPPGTTVHTTTTLGVSCSSGPSRHSISCYGTAEWALVVLRDERK